MISRAVAVVLLVLAAAANAAVVEVTIPAPSLQGNLFGDPAEQRVSIYLPPDYETSGERRYPVVYLLHGFLGTNRTWTQETGYSLDAPPILDALIASGAIHEMIAVAPNGRNALGGSFFVNSASTGNWEDYVVRDVVAYVDAHYRTLPQAASRGIAGHSMGGFAAIVLGMKHPDVFSAVYALSPCCLGVDDELASAPRLWKRLRDLKSLDDLPKRFKFLDDDFYLNVFAAMAAALSPNPARSPLHADLGAAAVAKWKATMPLYRIGEYKANLLALHGIVLDYGQKEEFPHIRSTTAEFSKRLAALGVPHLFEVYAEGTHSSKIKERLRTRVFPFFSERLDWK